jgi:hypothetical protein
MSYRLVWDPSDFTIDRVLVSTKRDFADDMLGDCPDDTWMIAIDRRCWTFPFDTWRQGVVGVLSVDDHIDFSTMSNFRVGIQERVPLNWFTA